MKNIDIKEVVGIVKGYIDFAVDEDEAIEYLKKAGLTNRQWYQLFEIYRTVEEMPADAEIEAKVRKVLDTQTVYKTVNKTVKTDKDGYRTVNFKFERHDYLENAVYYGSICLNGDWYHDGYHLKYQNLNDPSDRVVLSSYEYERDDDGDLVLDSRFGWYREDVEELLKVAGII